MIDMATQLFCAGSIVDYVEKGESTSEIINKHRRQLRNENPQKLVVLRQTAKGLYLVAVCCSKKKSKYLSVKTEKAFLFIRVSEFRIIDELSMKLCDDLHFTQSGYDIVNQIYSAHKRYLKEQKRKRKRKLQRKRNKALTTKNTHQQAETEKKKNKQKNRNYESEYECAIINNDRARMREIEEILGGAPNSSGMTSRHKRKSIPYSNFNPTPYRGGRFTPK